MNLNPKITPIGKPLKLGEGPFWDEKKQALFYVDIDGERFYQYKPSTKEIAYCEMGGKTSLVIPVENTTDKYVVSHGKKLMIVQWDGKSTKPTCTEDICEIIEDHDDNRINDGKCDPRGRLFAGTMANVTSNGEFVLGKGCFFRLDGKTPIILEKNISISNGLAWNEQNAKFYYIDTPQQRIDGYDYDIEKGEITNKTTIFDFKTNNLDLHPDGMCIDDEGKLWIATFNGSKIIRIDPNTGTLLYQLNLPAKQITSVCFGGPNRDIIYVTSAAVYEENGKPFAGNLFEITNLNIKGPASVPIKI